MPMFATMLLARCCVAFSVWYLIDIWCVLAFFLYMDFSCCSAASLLTSAFHLVYLVFVYARIRPQNQLQLHTQQQEQRQRQCNEMQQKEGDEEGAKEGSAAMGTTSVNTANSGGAGASGSGNVFPLPVPRNVLSSSDENGPAVSTQGGQDQHEVSEGTTCQATQCCRRGRREHGCTAAVLLYFYRRCYMFCADFWCCGSNPASSSPYVHLHNFILFVSLKLGTSTALLIFGLLMFMLTTSQERLPVP